MSGVLLKSVLSDYSLKLNFVFILLEVLILYLSCCLNTIVFLALGDRKPNPE